MVGFRIAVLALVTALGYFCGWGYGGKLPEKKSHLPGEVSDRSAFLEELQDASDVIAARDAKAAAAEASKAAMGKMATDRLAMREWLRLEDLLKNWGASAPYAALRWATSIDRKYRSQAIASILLGWLTVEPDQAFSWAAANYPGFYSRGDFYEAIAVAHRYDLGIRAINTLTHPDFALRNLANAWADEDKASLQLYLDHIRTEHRSAWLTLAQGLTAELAEGSLQAAVDWMNGNAASYYQKRMLAEATARSLLSNGRIEAVLDWADDASPTDGMNGVYRALAIHFASTEPEIAVSWMSKITDPEISENSTGVIYRLRQTRPDLAAKLVEQTRDSATRDHRLGLIVETWAFHDYDAAVDYVASSDALSDSKRAALYTALGIEIR